MDGLLPTPKASDGVFSTPSCSDRPRWKSTYLATRVMLLAGGEEHHMDGLLPTPKASDAMAERSRSGGRPPERSTALGMQVGLLPTPKASDANGPGAHGDGGPNLNTTMNDPRHYVPDSMFIPTPRASDVKGFNQRRNQENLTGAMLLGVESDTGVKWGRFEPAIRRWERILGRPAPCPLQATGSLRERLAPLAGTLLDPRWLVRRAPRRSGPALPDQPERDRTVRRWRAMSDGSDLIDPAVWDERWVADVDRTIPADRMPAPCVRRLWMMRLTAGGRRAPSERQLSPRFVEWMMGLPDGWVTDPNMWTGVPGNHRNLQLRLLGNGVVPPQAATAVRWACGVHDMLAA